MIQKSKGKRHEHEHAARHESDFRVAARRNKLLGLWAAEALGLPADQREAYAKEVVSADLEQPGDEDVIRKVMSDFEKHGVSLSRDELIKKLNTFAAEARVQLQPS
jgi:hypothetical protein